MQYRAPFETVFYKRWNAYMTIFSAFAKQIHEKHKSSSLPVDWYCSKLDGAQYYTLINQL